jgi:hypothetical protein
MPCEFGRHDGRLSVVHHMSDVRLCPWVVSAQMDARYGSSLPAVEESPLGSEDEDIRSPKRRSKDSKDDKEVKRRSSKVRAVL